MAGKSDRESVADFLRNMRAEGDPRVAQYEAQRKAAASERSRRGHQTRRNREAIRRRASTAEGREPITARVLGSSTSSPTSSPRMRDVVPPPMPGAGPGRVRVPRAPGAARPPAGLVPPPVKAPARRTGRNLSPMGYRAVTEAGNSVAARQQTKALLGAKPTVTGNAVGGAAAGAATGAALGTIVPGVGNAVGAGAGAAVGGVGGALSGGKKKRAYKQALHPAPGARKAVVAEFAVCIIIVALSPLTDKHKTDAPNAFMKRMAAVMGVFLILALLTAAGRSAARTAAAFGGLVTVVLLVSERDLFVQLATIFNRDTQEIMS